VFLNLFCFQYKKRWIKKQAPAGTRCRMHKYIPEEQRALTILVPLPPPLHFSGEVAVLYPVIALADFLFVTHLSQPFLPLVGSHFMAFTFFTAGHPVFTSFEDVICFS
jgi:hypothetical protein